MKSQQGLVVWMIWGSLLFALTVYAFIGLQAGELGPSPETSTLINILTLVGALSILLGFVVKHLFVTVPIAKGNYDPTKSDDFGKYLAAMIIAWALTESVGVFGLVARLTGQANPKTFLAFTGIAAFGMLCHRPVHLKPSL